jgi:hypothetical protein
MFQLQISLWKFGYVLFATTWIRTWRFAILNASLL